MRVSEQLPKIFVLFFILAGAAIFGFRYFDRTSEGARADINFPVLSALAEKGKSLFDANCASCHGANAAGSENGPPFIHKIYRPNHHADLAFLMAATRGVRAHHWGFGNMPPVPGVSEQDIKLIVAYVREMQKANGIF